jgi:hypothetical protein
MKREVAWDTIVSYCVVPYDEESPPNFVMCEIPEAQMDWINEVMQDYIRVQEYLSDLYEKKRRAD